MADEGRRGVSVVATSDCALNDDPDAGMSIAPLSFMVAGRVYDDHWDDTTRRALIAQSANVTTSAPTPASFLRAIERAAGRDVVVVTTGSRFSAAKAAARCALQVLGRQAGSQEVLLVDSQSAGPGLGILARLALSSARAGLSVREVHRRTTCAASNVRIVGWIPETASLIRSGRLGRLAGAVTTKLGIRPIFGLADGRIRLLALNEQAESAMAHVAGALVHTGRARIGDACILHVDAQEMAADLSHRLQVAGTGNVAMYEASPVVSLHLGRGAVVAAVISEAPYAVASENAAHLDSAWSSGR